jgi:hypothetical protein
VGEETDRRVSSSVLAFAYGVSRPSPRPRPHSDLPASPLGRPVSREHNENHVCAPIRRPLAEKSPKASHPRILAAAKLEAINNFHGNRKSTAWRALVLEIIHPYFVRQLKGKEFQMQPTLKLIDKSSTSRFSQPRHWMLESKKFQRNRLRSVNDFKYNRIGYNDHNAAIVLLCHY